MEAESKLSEPSFLVYDFSGEHISKELDEKVIFFLFGDIINMYVSVIFCGCFQNCNITFVTFYLAR